MKYLKEAIKNYFATGLLVIVPLIVTLWLIKSVVVWVDEIFAIQKWSPVFVPGFGLILAFLLILFAGMLGRNVLGSWLVTGLSEVLKKVPFIGSVYAGLKQTMESLFSGGSGKRFGKAVLVEYPRVGAWSVGFVTLDKTPDQLKTELGLDMITVFIPTTPNPTSGFLIFVPRSQVKPLGIKVDEAFKLVVSLGLVESGAKDGN